MVLNDITRNYLSKCPTSFFDQLVEELGSESGSSTKIGRKSQFSCIPIRNAQTLTLALEMINMNPETPLNTPHTNSPRRTGLNGEFDVDYSRVEHLVEVWLKLKCNIYVQLMLICIECSLKLPLICYKFLNKMYQFFYF